MHPRVGRGDLQQAGVEPRHDARLAKGVLDVNHPEGGPARRHHRVHQDPASWQARATSLYQGSNPGQHPVDLQAAIVIPQLQYRAGESRCQVFQTPREDDDLRVVLPQSARRCQHLLLHLLEAAEIQEWVHPLGEGDRAQDISNRLQREGA
jgi:hypothetical protein